MIKPAKPPITIKLALAVKSKGVDLRRGRVYRIIADKRASADGYVRIIDDSGEDYLYPASSFQIIRLSADQAARLF